MPTSVRDALARRPLSGTSRSSERGSALYRSVSVLTVFAMLFGGLLLLTPSGASAQSTATTTDYLNLRQGPSTGTAIITTMPNGASVTINGSPDGSFYPVTYNGMSGYAHGDWLSIGGSGSTPPPASGSGPTGNATVTSALNLRSGPSTGNSILTVMPSGASVTLTGESAGGFYGVVYNGISGYAHSDWISVGGSAPAPAPSDPGSGSTPVGDTVVGTATVTAYALNVRSGPSTGYSILSTVVSGQVIDIMGDPQGGFYPMRAGGVSGWVSGDYISMGGAAAPAPDPEPEPAPAPSDPGSGSVAVGDTVVNTAVVTAGALNMRSGPSTSYPVITGMGYGVQVNIMGSPQGGFYPVEYLGTKGWASGDYLNIGATGSGPSASEQEIINIIYAAADAYGQPRADMLRVARCESVLDPNAVNPYSGASGLFQFMPGTWLTTPFANEDIFDPVANANAAGWMWSVGRRNEWTCQ